MNGRRRQDPGPAGRIPGVGTSPDATRGGKTPGSPRVTRKAGGRGWPDFLFALLAFTLLFGCQFGAWASEWNRVSAHWERENALALILLVLLPALAAWGIGRLLRLRRALRLCRILDGLLLFVLLTGLVSMVPGVRELPDAVRMTAWLLLGSVTLLPVLTPRWFRLIRSVALIFAILPPILFVQALLWPPVGTSVEEKRDWERGPCAGAPAVVLLVYDEWSYLRAAMDGRFRPCLPHLRDLCRSAMFFSEARSVGDWTMDSIPRLLYQTGAGFLIRDHRACFGEGRQVSPVGDRESIFDRARAAGYETAVVGFYLPYRFILGETVDYCRSYPYVANPPTLTGRMRYHLTENLRHLADPLSIWLAERSVSRLHDRHMRRVTEAIHTQGLELVSACSGRNLVFIHEVGGHPPFLRLTDGRFREERVAPKPVYYEEQVRTIDQSVGDYVAVLEGIGRFDETLLIITSDHAWRKDPGQRIRAEKDWPRRVPLVVKWPGQRSAVRLDAPCSHLLLGRLIDLAMAGGTLEEAIELTGGIGG